LKGIHSVLDSKNVRKMKKDKIINGLYFLFLYFMEGLCIAMFAVCVYSLFKTGNPFILLYLTIVVLFYINLRKERRSDKSEFGGMKDFIKAINGK